MIVRLKGVKRVRSKGRDYFYHRRTMTPLPGKPGSAEFIAKLHEIERREQKVFATAKTLGSLIVLYRLSPEFTNLAPSSQRAYQPVFDRLKPNEPTPLSAIDSAWVFKLRDIVAAERAWSFTNRVVTVLRLLFEWGRRRGHCRDNPAKLADLVRRPRDLPDRNRPWTPAELDTVLQAAPAWLRVPIAIAAYTGLREGDVARVTWAAYDGETFRARSQKTGVPTLVKAHYRLREILDATPRRGIVIVTNAAGEPMTKEALRTAFFRVVRPLGLGLTFHGLRHSLGTAIVELGGTNEEGAAVLGHTSTRTTAGYSKRANRSTLADRAIERIEERDRNAARKTDRKTAG